MTLTAAVINVKALEAGAIRSATGVFVHGFWFHHWQKVAPALADELHAEGREQPFALSPLMGLRHPTKGRIDVEDGAEAWFRVTTLSPVLSAALTGDWLPALPEEITLGSLRWGVAGYTLDPEAHPWAGEADAGALAERYLLGARPARRWRLRFATPTAFHGEAGHLPFPLPHALTGSWLRRWQAFGPVRLPEEVLDAVRAGVAVSAYRLKTVPVRDRERLTIGCVGRLTLAATALSKPGRAAVDLLAAFAFWAGSGHRTTQGMGMTRRVSG